MTNFKQIAVAFLMLIGLSSQAQDKNNPWAITIGANAVDTRTSAELNNKWLDAHFSQLYKTSNWNILPSISYLNVSRYLGNNFSFGVAGSINKISKAVYVETPGSEYRNLIVSNPGDLMFYGVDGTFKYSFMGLLKSKVIDPSLNVGGGYKFIGKNSFGTANAGLGLTLWFNENVGLSLASTYNHSFGDRNDASGKIDSPSFMQHTAGITFKFGGKDSDGDGIYDKDDACPTQAGLKQFNGCPDTDGDGIADKDDACPNEAGLREFNGCPDTDGDGIADKDDACPTQAGSKALKGCPDADGDGVADKDDKCPSVKGPKENAGCPWPDTDGDGVLDKDDKCPTVKGTVANNGCPEEVAAEVIKQLNAYAKTILFNTGKATFQKQTLPVLESIAAILKENSYAKFSIEGHTDNVGKPASNLKLSKDRAAAVKNYLINNGVNANNLTSEGYGQTRPIDSNKTAKGKANNRRVEVKLVK